MKLLLVYPPFYRLKSFKSIFLPLGIASLAAYLQKPGREIKLYNADNPAEGEIKGGHVDQLLGSTTLFEQNLKDDSFVVWKEFETILKDFKPDIVGISVMTCKYTTAAKLSKIAKNVAPDTVVVWGGPHCSAEGVSTLNDILCIDYVITNEGEAAFNQLVEALENNQSIDSVPNLIYRDFAGSVAVNPPAKAIQDLDILPFPARDIDIFQERYPNWGLNTIMGSRGCPYKCSYCDSRSIWGRRVRRRSVDNIIAEMKTMHERWKINDFHFVDDTFTLDPEYTIAFCDALVESRLNVGWTCNTRMNVLSDRVCEALKRSGIIFISCGIETGSQRMLDYINKGITLEKVEEGARLLKKHGIDWHAFLMVGFPQETLEDMEMTRQFWKKLNPGCATLSIFTPSPGTELMDEVKSLGLLDDKPNWSSLSWQDMSSYFAVNIPKEDFDKKVKQMFEEVQQYNNSLGNLARKIFKRRRYYLSHLNELPKKAFLKFTRKKMKVNTTR